MKKSLVLAMAMALGVTASAYAANPFSDVPAGHWAYDSISKLAAAGVIEGYGDDTFRGDRLMTRYEMAQIVAKAMAKGANVDKLAAEFADELERLHVRVAALEKNSDNVKLTGQNRYNYAHWRASDGIKGNGSNHRLRSRVYFNGKVNDNWNYQGMIENIQHFTNNVEDGTTKFRLANINGRLGGARVTAGRYFEYRGDGNIYDEVFDGIKVEYGDKIRLDAYYGKPTQGYGFGGYYTDPKYDRAYGASVAADLGKKVTVTLGYDRFVDGSDYDATGVRLNKRDGFDNSGIFSIGMNAKLIDKLALNAMYLKSNADIKYVNDVTKTADDDGFVVGLNYGGANYNKPGTWGLEGKYYDLGAATFIAHTMNADPARFTTEGFKGWKVAGYVTVAKGMRAGIEYYDLKGKISDFKQRTLWGELQIRY